MNERGGSGGGSGKVDGMLDITENVNMVLTGTRKEGDLLGKRESGS